MRFLDRLAFRYIKERSRPTNVPLHITRHALDRYMERYLGSDPSNKTARMGAEACITQAWNNGRTREYTHDKENQELHSLTDPITGQRLIALVANEPQQYVLITIFPSANATIRRDKHWRKVEVA